MKIILESEFNVEYPNHNVWGARTNLRFTNLLPLVQLNSLYLQSAVEYLYLQLSFLCSAWQHKGETLAYTTEEFQKTCDSWKTCQLPSVACQQHLFLTFWVPAFKLRNISTSDQRCCNQSVPSGPAFWTKERSHVLNVSLTQEVSIIWTNTFHPSFGKWQLCETAAGRQKSLPSKHVQHKVLTASYSYGLAVLKCMLL